jgi:hypothetical protein
MSQRKGIAELSGVDRSMIARELAPQLEEMEKSIERFRSRMKRLEEEEKRKKEMEEMFIGATSALANLRKSLEKKGGRKRTRRMRNKRLRKSSRK